MARPTLISAEQSRQLERARDPPHRRLRPSWPRRRALGRSGTLPAELAPVPRLRTSETDCRRHDEPRQPLPLRTMQSEGVDSEMSSPEFQNAREKNGRKIDPENGRFLPEHGMYGRPEYLAWIAMKKRCYSPANASYPNYGGRGIKVCAEWRESFASFFMSMGERPSPLHSLDRVDNDGNYTPQNCVWSDKTQQVVNRRSTVFLSYQGRTQCLSHWATERRIPRATLRQRIDAGWSMQDALEKPIDVRRGIHS